jgi:hypothetical protein
LITQAPWLQYLPSPHSASPAQDFTHAPLTHFGAAGSAHSASPAHPPDAGGVGWQTPFSHVEPSPHGADVQLVRHWPSAHTFPAPHSLEYVHVSSFGVHAPETQTSPPAQSAAFAHGHGPALPPQASHFPAAHALPSPQSAFVVHSTGAPASVPGAAQTPPAPQASPFGQSAFAAQIERHPVAVQVSPAWQLVLPVQVGCAGALAREQP